MGIIKYTIVCFFGIQCLVGSIFAETVTLEIPYGSTLRNVAGILDAHRVIPNQTVFRILATLTGNATDLKSGVYKLTVYENRFDLNHTMGIIKVLKTGIGIQVRVTVPEGLTKKEIFTVLRKSALKNDGKYERFDRHKRILKRIGEWNATTESTEGFYFPDTYFFSKNTSELTVLMAMVTNFFAKTPPLKSYSSPSTLTPYQILILASIIEKETGKHSERKRISSVFHNRLQKKIPLATDPTVIYGIENFTGNLRKIHLRTRTPYNTYLIAGLPPTPISSPGLASIDAALHPENTPYLYFVAKGDGYSYFSKNLREHERAVRKYQINRRKDYRSH